MKTKKQIILTAAKAAFPPSLPIFAGFTFVGIAYGIYMKSLGFSAEYPILMSIFIFAGSMQFVAAGLLTQAFAPLNAFLMTVMVNARHIFYGLSMLEKYRNVGKKKGFLIFGLCDETFSINCTAAIPEQVNRGWFYFFVTLFDYCYWIFGSSLGGLFGTFLTFNTTGIDFVMTALFLVIFVNQWEKGKTHVSSLCGLGVSLVCLLIFGPGKFIPASMAGIIILLSALRKPLFRKTGDAE